jgi:photosystem II stability/assembly factor-like uncharacterized protein
MKHLFAFLFVLPSILFAQAPASTGTERLAAFRQHQTLTRNSPYKSLRWRLIGPDSTSGRATDIRGVAGNRNIAYAGFATGGVWKTEDAGRSWKAIFDGQGTQSIGNIGVAPSNPNIVYVGTGEANIFRASLPGLGVYKTLDGGKTWTHLGLENTGTISRIVVHPTNPNVAFVAASGNEWTYNEDRGVYKTTDGGRTWQRVLFRDEKTGAIDLVMDPSDPNTLYASMWNRIRRRWSDPVPEAGDFVYKTTDSGKTWTLLTNGLPDTRFTGRVGLSISAKNPNVVYAFIDNHTPAREPRPDERDAYGRQKELVVKGAEVYRSDNKGESWQKASDSTPYMENLSGTYGWVFGQIKADPNDENTVYILGLGISKSVDGGKTFSPMRINVHGDHHGLWIDPTNSNYMLNNNDGGVNTSYDGGKTWTTFYTIPTTQFYNVAYDMATPFNVQGSVQDEGSMGGNVQYIPNRANQKVKGWEYVPGGEGTHIAIDPRNPNVSYSSSFYGRLMRSDRSQSGRDRSKNLVFPNGEGEPALRGEWMAATILSPHDPNTIYHGFQYLYKSSDQGQTWTRISPDLTAFSAEHQGKLPYAISHAAITALSESPMKKGVLYVGTDDGRVHISLNDGTSWTEATGLPAYTHVSRIEASRFVAGTVYLTLNDRRQDNITPQVFKSTDFGKTWQRISGNLPASPVNVIREDPKNRRVLYLGTDLGVYISKNATTSATNRGVVWQTLQGNLPASVLVQDLFVHPRDNVMVIATYGRGIYVLDNVRTFQR